MGKPGRKQVVRSLVEEIPSLCGEERWCQALHDHVEWKSGSRQRLMLRSHLSQLIQVWVFCLPLTSCGIMAQMRVTCLHLFFLSENHLNQHQQFSKECFKKDAKCSRMLDQTHLVSEGLLFSDVSTLIKTKHEDSHAWDYRQKSSIAGSFRDLSGENKANWRLGLVSHCIEWAVECFLLSDLTHLPLHLPFLPGRSE